MQLRVAINGQIRPNSGVGGVESVLTALITALGNLTDGPEEYVIIGPYENNDWLETFMGPNQQLVRGPGPTSEPKVPQSHLMRAMQRPFRPFRRFVGGALQRFLPPPPRRLWPEVPLSDGFYESLGCDVIHFPYQKYVVCARPTIFNPHDLQHVHFPQYFTPTTIAAREVVYGTGCRLAHTVAVGSQWVKDDLVHHFGISPTKVQVIPWAPPTVAHQAPSEDLVARVKDRYGLLQPFALYPAMIWEHKNHLRLLEAIAALRDQEGITVRLVCTGKQSPPHWNRIEDRLRDLRLEGQVQFLGMVPPEELRAIYRLAQFVVVPTLFEAASGPVFEAWEEGTPVACSWVTSLPEQVKEAGLLFDPLSVDAIRGAIRRMATDEDLRSDLKEKGRRRLQHFSWERTAKAYRALYRRAAGQPLSGEDQALLRWDWMREVKSGLEV